MSEPNNKPTVTGTLHGITCSECAQLRTRLAEAEDWVDWWKDMAEKEHALAVEFATERDILKERER